jgi:hypothetical protein
MLSVKHKGLFACFSISVLLLVPARGFAEDSDGNGVEDGYEWDLAYKFIPSLVLETGDQGVCPKEVNMMGLNQGFSALYVRVFNVLGQLVGDFSVADQFDPTITSYLGQTGHPEIYNGNYSFLQPDPYQYVGRPPGASYAVYWLVFHYEFGDAVSNTPSAWYSHYQNIQGNYGDLFYARLKRLEGTGEQENRVLIQYWFFYPFNDWVNNHEGDWEHINVVVDSEIPQSASIVYIEYFFHFHLMRRFTAGEGYHVVDDTHPVVFVGGWGYLDPPFQCFTSEGHGYGSHGSYPIFGFWPAAGGNIICVGDVDETLNQSGLYRKWCEFDLEVIRDPGAIDFNANPELSWLKARIPWGHLDVNSPGEWTELIPFFGPDNVGEMPPASPPNQPTWSTVGEVGDFTSYYDSHQGPVDSWAPPTPAPTDLEAINNWSYYEQYQNIMVSWEPLAICGDFEVAVVRKPDGGSWSEIGRVSGQSYLIDETALGSELYYYRARTYEGGNYSSYSEAVALRAWPQIPENASAIVNPIASNVVYVYWDPPTQQKPNTISNYTIRRLEGGGNAVYYGPYTSSPVRLCEDIETSHTYTFGVRSNDIYSNHSIYTANTVTTGQFDFCASTPNGGGNLRGVIDVAQVPQKTFIGDNYPNPFNNSTAFPIGLAHTENVDLRIYNIAGQEVVALVNNQSLQPGCYYFTWAGRDRDDQALSTGVYFCVCRVGELGETKKILLVK